MCELTARYGRGTAWARHAMCESALTNELSRKIKHTILIKILNGILNHEIKEQPINL
jgi:hypothetical protein